MPDLCLNWDDLMRRTARNIGVDRGESASEQMVQDYIDTGYNRFLHPPPIDTGDGFSIPDLLTDLANCILGNGRRHPLGFRLANVHNEGAQDLVTFGGVLNFRVELDTIAMTVAVTHRCNG